MRPRPILLAISLLLAGCGGDDETVANKFERTEAAIENRAGAFEAQVENEVSALEARLDNETDAFLNAARDNAAEANGGASANATR